MHRHFNELSCTHFIRWCFLLLFITALVIISNLSSNASYAEEQGTSSWETTLMQAAACVEWDLDQLHFEACDPEGGPPINVYSSYLVPVSARITCPNTEYCSAAEATSNSGPGYVEIAGILSPPTTSSNLPWAMPGALFKGTNSFSSPVIIKFDTTGLGEFTGLAHIIGLYTDMTTQTESLTLETEKQYRWIQPNPDKIAKSYQVTVNLGGIAKPKSPSLHIRSEVEIIDKCAEWQADTDTATHCPGVTFQICNSDLGIRIKRIKNGEVGYHYPQKGYEEDPVDKKGAWQMMQEYGPRYNCLKSADLPPPTNSEDPNKIGRIVRDQWT